MATEGLAPSLIGNEPTGLLLPDIAFKSGCGNLTPQTHPLKY